MINMNDQFQFTMQRAVDAYRQGSPVVVLSKENAPIHGVEELRAVVDLNMELDDIRRYGY